MGLLGNQQNIDKWNGIRTNSSILGTMVPILLGQNRCAARLIWYGDFVAAHAKQQGGKGLGKGGVQYIYTASIIALLAHGPLNYLLNVWASGSRYQLISASESYSISSGAGLNYTALNASIYANDQGVAAVTPYSVGPFTDFGAPGPTTLSGNQNIPLVQVSGTPSAGQYSVNQTTGVYTFAAADVGKSVVIAYSFYRYRLVTEEITVVPFTPGPYTVTVDNSLNFIGDNGVNYYPSGTAFVFTSGTPSVGQYTRSGATYTFNASDQGQPIVISYEYKDPNTDTNAPNTLNLTLVNGAIGQSPTSYMTARHPSQALGYSGLGYIFSNALYLGYSPALPNFSYELAGAFQVGAGIVDCNPVNCIEAILTDPHFGVGFPSQYIGDWTLPEQCWQANSFFISPFLDNSESCSSHIGKWLEAGMTAGFWSEGLLKLVPYGDSTAVGNGVTYSPPTGPIASLTDDDYLVDRPEDPVKVERTAWQDVYNRVRVSYAARVNDYNPEVIYEQDDSSITTYGLRLQDPKQYDFICTLPAAQYAASMLVQRNCYIRNTYTFRVSSSKSWFEPMDVIELNDINLGLENTPVRITKIEDDPIKGLSITAEDFLWGAATPAYNPKQANSPTGGGDPHADPGNTNAVIFEAPDRLGLYGGNVLYMFCSGINSNWGGCHVWYSYDGTNYALYSPLGGINAVTQPARIGTLQNSTQVSDDLTSGSLANWTTVAGTFVATTSVSPHGVYISSVPTTNATMYYSATAPSSQDHWSQVTFLDPAGFASIGPAVRIQDPADTFYVLTKVLGSIYIQKYIAGVVTSLSNVSYSVVTGDVLRLQIVGSQLTASVNGVVVLTATDTSITGGSWGIAGDAVASSSSPRVNYFSGGGTPLASYSSANPDTVDTALIQLSQNGDTLPSVSSADAAQGVSLCALANIISGAIELFSYETSTLEGSGLYALTTLYRGLYGTAAVAHFAGETFARLDEASLIYQYDPSYVGKTIYFKFTSFNLYGQMEQALPNVEAISFPLAGVGIGMYSLENGLINSTFYIPQVNAFGTILTGMGLTQSGTSTTIDMASGTAQFGSGTVSYNSASVNPGSYGTFYVFFDDPTYTGGSITLQASTSLPDIYASPGRFYAGKITTTSGGGGSGGGTGGGGTGGGRGTV